MKHEEFNLRYNEIMFDERDMIVNFLKKQADLRYGNQMYEWTLEPMPELVGTYGSLFKVREVLIDKNGDLKFIVPMAGGHSEAWDCCNFAYNELSKVIDVLPDAEDVIFKNAKDDLVCICKNYRDCYLSFDENPFCYEVSGKPYRVSSVRLTEKGHLSFGQETCEDWEVGDFTYGELASLRDHINVQVLRGSDEYKRLKRYLKHYNGAAYSFIENNNAGAIYLTPSGTDLQLYVLDVCIGNNGIEVLVSIKDTRIEIEGDDTMILKEKDLTPANLAVLNGFFFEESDIMDTLNAHNKELVRKINKAWRTEKHHKLFGGILLALLIRDHEEYEDKFDTVDDYSEDFAMEHAHEILEHVCDDMDLETVLSFVRYMED